MTLKFVPDQVRGKSCRSTSQVRLKILNYRTLHSPLGEFVRANSTELIKPKNDPDWSSDSCYLILMVFEKLTRGYFIS
jgi:hypothetical protein